MFPMYDSAIHEPMLAQALPQAWRNAPSGNPDSLAGELAARVNDAQRVAVILFVSIASSCTYIVRLESQF